MALRSEIAKARILAILTKEGRMTAREIGDRAFMSASACKRYLMAMRTPGPGKCIRVCGWEDGKGGRRTAIYEVGTGPNRSEPTRVASATVWQARKARMAKHNPMLAWIKPGASAVERFRELLDGPAPTYEELADLYFKQCVELDELGGKAELMDDYREVVRQRDRLQRIIDTRPALNAGTLEAYIAWTHGIYTMDMANALETAQ